MRMQPAGRRRQGPARDRRPMLIQAHNAGPSGRQSIAQRRLGDQHGGARIFQHEGKTLRRVARIQRQIGAAGLEDPQEPNHHRGRALHAQPHNTLRTHPERPQVMRQLIGPPLKLAVAEAFILKHNRHSRGAPRRLRGKQVRQRRRRKRMPSVVPVPQNGATLRGGENLQTADRRLRRPNRTLQKPYQTCRQLLDRQTIK